MQCHVGSDILSYIRVKEILECQNMSSGILDIQTFFNSFTLTICLETKWNCLIFKYKRPDGFEIIIKDQITASQIVCFGLGRVYICFSTIISVQTWKWYTASQTIKFLKLQSNDRMLQSWRSPHFCRLFKRIGYLNKPWLRSFQTSKADGKRNTIRCIPSWNCDCRIAADCKQAMSRCTWWNNCIQLINSHYFLEATFAKFVQFRNGLLLSWTSAICCFRLQKVTLTKFSHPFLNIATDYHSCFDKISKQMRYAWIDAIFTSTGCLLLKSIMSDNDLTGELASSDKYELRDNLNSASIRARSPLCTASLMMFMFGISRLSTNMAPILLSVL